MNSLPGEQVRGEPFEAGELDEVKRQLALSHDFIPEYQDVENFLRLFLRSENLDITAVPGEPGIFSVSIPKYLKAELGGNRCYPFIFSSNFRADTQQV